MLPKRLFDIARNSLENLPNPAMFVTKKDGDWKKTSTAEFLNMANAVSRGLLKMGLQPGDKVALITHATCTEWAVMDYALQQIGIITVPVYPTISAEDYVFIFSNSEVKYCFVSDDDLYKKVMTAKENLPALQGIFSFDEIKGAPNWSEVVDLGKEDGTQSEVEDISKTISEDSVATIIYTSGTTGKPKGVCLTHKNILANVMASDSRIPRKKGLDYKDTKVLSFLPICHIFERMLFYLFQYNGFSVYFAESIDKMGENVKEVQPHYMSVVPRLIEKVYDRIYATGSTKGGFASKIFHWALEINSKKKTISKPSGIKEIIADKLVFSKWREGLGGNILALVSGSAALSERLNLLFQNAGIPILEGYGLTETSPVIAVNSKEFMKVGTVGKPLENLQVKIQEDGEITVKGPSVFHEYFKNEQLTKEAFTEDGFFRTGDIGHIDSDGFLKITDRKKEMFKTSGGKYIAPQMIENLAKASKFIEQIMVVGEGEKMATAFIQPDFSFAKEWAKRHGANIGSTNEEIAKSTELKDRIKKEITELNKKLGQWEQIKDFEMTPEIWSVDNGMLTPTLKLKRKAIKEKYTDLYNKLYHHD